MNCRTAVILAVTLLISGVSSARAQFARLTVYNDTSRAINFLWSSDVTPLTVSLNIDRGTSRTFTVAVRTIGITNFIAVADILLPIESLPGAKFELETGKQKYVTVKERYPSGYVMDIMPDRLLPMLLGDQLFGELQKRLESQAIDASKTEATK